MSSPHFYQNPDYLRTAFDGISPPNPDDHETRLYIEPTTGMSIKINKRIQVRISAIHFGKKSIIEKLWILYLSIKAGKILKSTKVYV
jgi:hypothetical protein